MTKPSGNPRRRVLTERGEKDLVEAWRTKNLQELEAMPFETVTGLRRLSRKSLIGIGMRLRLPTKQRSGANWGVMTDDEWILWYINTPPRPCKHMMERPRHNGYTKYGKQRITR